MWLPEKSSIWSFKFLYIHFEIPKTNLEFDALIKNGMFMVLDEPNLDILNKVILLRILCAEYGIVYYTYAETSSVSLHPELYFKRIA
jgi:hypothetical protein